MPSAVVRYCVLSAVLILMCSAPCAAESDRPDLSREIAARTLFAEGDKLLEATDPAGALAVFQRVVKEYPGTHCGAVAEFRCAEALVQLGYCDKALAQAQSAIDAHPKTVVAAWAQHAIGQALLKKGDEYGGVLALRKVKQMLPDKSDLTPLDGSRLILGSLCERRLGSRMDILDLAEYLGADKNNTADRAEIYAIMAAFKGGDGRIDLANPVLDRLASECASETDELEWARSEVAMSYLDSRVLGGGEFAKLATRMLEPLLKPGVQSNDQAAKACLSLARYYKRGKMPSKALEILQQGSKHCIDTARGGEILYELGRALAQEGRAQEATAVMKRLAEEKPLSAQAMVVRSLAEEDVLGDSSASLDSLVKAAAAEWRPEWGVLALYPKDGSLGSRTLIARQAVALAQEDRPDVAVGLIDSFAERNGISAGEAARAGSETVLAAIEYAADKGAFSREALYAFQILRKDLDSHETTLLLSRIMDVTGKNLGRLSDRERPAASMWLQSELFRQARYRDAADVLTQVVKSASVTSEVAANARYQLGMCYHNMGSLDLARDYMQWVVGEYGNTYWARKARGALYVWSNYGERSKPK